MGARSSGRESFLSPGRSRRSAASSMAAPGPSVVWLKMKDSTCTTHPEGLPHSPLCYQSKDAADATAATAAACEEGRCLRAHLNQTSEVEAGAAQEGVRKLHCQQLQDARQVNRQLEHDRAPPLGGGLHAPTPSMLVMHLLQCAKASKFSAAGAPVGWRGVQR